MKTLLLLGLAAVTIYFLRPKKRREEPLQLVQRQPPETTPGGAFHLGR